MRATSRPASISDPMRCPPSAACVGWEVRCLGAPKGGPGWKATLDEMITKAVDDALEGAAKKAKRTDSALEQLITRAARGVAVHHWGKKPVMTVLITRLEDD